MTEEMLQQHREKLDEIRKKLLQLGSRESSFMAVELLFYESISIARSYGTSTDNNNLLIALKQLEAGAYANTKNYFKKSHQREHVIKRFMVQFKNILASGIKESIPG